MAISKDLLPQVAATLASGFIAQRTYNGTVPEAARDIVLVFDAVLAELERQYAEPEDRSPGKSGRLHLSDGPGAKL